MSSPKLHHQFADVLPEMSAAVQPTLPSHDEDLSEPELVVLNEPLAEELGLDSDWLKTRAGLEFLLGRQLPTEAYPVAQAYAGHQFGQFNPRMGDGRAVLLGELEHGPQGQLVDLHVKGAGLTPLARPGADGKAAIGPTLREYLVSEFMHAVGVPTTRALAVIKTGDTILRHVLQDAAVVVRVASSHIRVGSFQLARMLKASATAPSDQTVLARLADFVINRHYPEQIAAKNSTPYADLYAGIMNRQAELIAQWMRLSFIHGVMNTDNTAVSGETLDYGPCAFMDDFAESTVFSSIDTGGRYAYGQQPAIGGWNMARLAEAMLPLFDSVDEVQEILNDYPTAYRNQLDRQFGLALGLENTDLLRPLVDEFQELVEQLSVDLTITLRLLSDHGAKPFSTINRLGLPEQFESWFARWQKSNPDFAAMQQFNPIYIPRNAHVDEALSAAEHGDMTIYRELLDAVTHPFARRGGYEKFETPGHTPPGFLTYCGT